MDVKPFPLFKLPDVPRSLVFKQFEIHELVTLSMNFRRVRRFATAYKSHEAELTWEFNDYYRRSRMTAGRYTRPWNTYMSVFLHFPKMKKKKKNVKYHFLSGTLRSIEPIKVVNVGGEWPLPIEAYDKKYEYTILGRNDFHKADPRRIDMKFMEKLSILFEDIFRARKYNVRLLQMREFNLAGSFIWKTLKVFENITISDQKISYKTTRFFLEELKVRHLILDVETTCSRNKPLTLKYPQIDISNCNYATIEDVMNCSSEKLSIEFKSVVSMDQLVEVVNVWISATKLNGMKKINLEWPERKNQSNATNEFFKKMEGVGEKIPNETNKITVKRATDGEIATVEFNGCFFSMTLQKADDEEDEEYEEYEDDEEDEEDEDDDEDEEDEEEEED
ncbi:hypothetical protein CRE_05985 [Caenorhabditis remanei]|uniref:F-box domain-containing protein n=1 Tax=Caenorhabditis remanei TaxID=31234 RepID=E3MZE3_CAERE|nr:hypothetical protein CRE_05985 [Caenorhabditis remanei]